MGYGAQVAYALILSIPVACIAWTVTQEEVFQEFRDFLSRYRTRHRQSWWRRKLAYMPTCPYCLSHYIAAMLIVLLRFKMLADDWRGYLVSLFTLVLIANVYVTLYHMLRVGLRWLRSSADRAARPAFSIRKRTIPNPATVASMDVTGTVPARQRTARSLPPDRRA